VKRISSLLVVIIPTILILVLLFSNIISYVDNEFGGGRISDSGYINENIGLEVDFLEGMAYAGSNVGEGDYLFDILGREWFRMYFMPRFAEGMDLQIRIRDVSDMSNDFLISRIVAEYRSQGFDFDPTRELRAVIRDSGTHHGFSVYRRREWVMRDIADSISYLFVKRHGNALVQIFITRYSPDQAQALSDFLASIRFYKPANESPTLVASTPATEPDRILLDINHLPDDLVMEFLREKNLEDLERYGEYLALYGLTPAAIHGPVREDLLDGYLSSEQRRLVTLWGSR
jgi:hypothetical protein